MENLIYTRRNYFLILSFIIILLNMDLFAQRYWNIAAKFDGTNSVAVIPYTSLQNISGSFTVECWFKADQGGWGTLFGKTGLRLLIDPQDDKFRGRMQTNNNTKLYTRYSSAMEYNKWYHLACTYNSTTGVMNFYINGSIDTSFTSTGYGPAPDTDTLYIGNSIYGPFKGMIDDIRIWNRDLSGNEVSANMRNPYVGPLSSGNAYFGSGAVMSANFDFSYTSGGGLYFWDGYNTYTNLGAEAVELGAYPSQTLNINPALDLTGTGYVKMPSSADLEFTRPVTAEVWVYPLSPGGSSQYILRKGNDYGIYIDDTGLIRFIFSAVGSSSSPIPANKWTHLAITCDESGIGSLYINGRHDRSFNFGTGPTPGNDTLYIGASNYSSQFFNGYIDAVKISNYKKSEEEIQRDMFRIIDFGNRPQPPHSTVSLNFDYFNYSSTGIGTYYYYGGNAKSTTPGLSANIPVSPVIGNNISFFDEYNLRQSGKRIPSSNTAGYMEVDSLVITDSSLISDLQFFIALNHERLTDLRIMLQSPSGDSVIVWDGNYGKNNNIKHIITVFDDDADSSIINGAYVDFGPYIKPINSLKSSFIGKSTQGVWKVKITDLYNGSIGYLYAWGLRIEKQLTGIEENYSSLPNEFKLEQNYPNPFNPTTNFEFRIADFGLVSLKVYDVLGREAATLVNEVKEPGSYNISFDASNLSSGIYFYRLKSGSFSDTKKLILLK